MIELGVSRGPDRAELRSDVVDSYINLLQGALASPAVTAAASAAVEIASGLWGRTLATAEVTGAPVGARMLHEIGRRIARQGEALYLYDAAQDGTERLLRASLSDVWGDSPDPADWWYRLYLEGPRSTTDTVVARADRVCHFRYDSEPNAPARGLSPLVLASMSGELLRNLERSLGYESNAPVGLLVPIPDGNEPDDDLLTDIRNAKGRVLMPETMKSGHGDSDNRPARDWEPIRLGSNPPQSLIQLRRSVEDSILGAFGIPAPLGPGGLSDGTAMREAIRRLWSTTIGPVAAMVAEELERVLERPVSLNHAQPAGAADIAARARSVHVLVQAGVDKDRAMALVGWEQ